jgi:serine/threonine-protein kinase
LLYEMLTGRVPFIGDGYGEILVQHLTQPPTPPSTFRGLSPHVEAVVLKALEKRPELRFPTMDEFMRAMADPVGYVEAMGGIAGFGQRPIMPSSSPPHHISRLTPSPLLSPPVMTPPPGTLTPIPVGAKPTTLGASSGEVQGGGARRVGLIAAIALLAIGAAAGTYLVIKNKKDTPAASTDPGSGSVVVDDGSGSAGAGSNTDLDGSGDGSGTGATGPIGDGSGSGSSKTTVGDGSGSSKAGSGDGSGSGTGSGSAVATIERITILITTNPKGAMVSLNGLKLGRTPLEAMVPKKAGKTAKLRIELSGHAAWEEKIPLGESYTANNIQLRKRQGGGKGSGKDKCARTNGTDLVDPDCL